MAGEQDKVEMEAVPLKQDTDAEAGTAPEVVEKPKKTWFFCKAKKPVVEGEATAEEDEPKKPKKCFWQCRKSAEPVEGAPEAMTCGLDMTVRDEKSLNDVVKIQFDDVFGEPDTFHSWDCAWQCVFKVFEFCRTFFYKLFALIICLPAAIIFGVLFALVSVISVFVVVPIARLASIPLTWIAVAWSFIVRNVFDPITKSFGNCWSNIHIRKYGLDNSPTMTA